jgi:5-methylcytosine-specific restriction endonuclease McrA
MPTLISQDIINAVREAEGTQYAIAAKFGISQPSVNRIRNGKQRVTERRYFQGAETYKASGQCNRCGSSENLVWDHIDPATKELDVMSMVAKKFSHERIMREIAKCQVLCSGCNTRKYHREDRYR